MEPVEPAPQPRIVRPARTEPATEAPADPEPQVVVAPQPEPEPVAPVGLIRDETPADTGTDTDPAPRPRQDPDPQPEPRQPRPRPEPEPEPTREPRPQPEPEPTENTQQYELKTGSGHSVHTAESSTDQDASRYWEFIKVERHHGQGTGEARTATARLTAQLTNASLDRNADEFQCAAWLDAGDRRLITDTEHYFTVTLVELDANYQPTGQFQQVIHQQAYDLRAGKSTRSEPMLNEPFPVDPANGFHYTCEAEYVAK